VKGRRASRAKAAGQSVEATVTIGRGGLTEGNAAEVARQLKERGLVKVKIAREAAGAEGRHKLAEDLAARAGGELVEVRGLTALFASRGRRGRL
jgi:RNA-binding protein